jgi:hypothetical protein
MGKLGQASEKRVRMRAGGRESQVTPCASRTPASGLTGGARSLARSGRSSNLTRGSAAHGRQARGCPADKLCGRAPGNRAGRRRPCSRRSRNLRRSGRRWASGNATAEVQTESSGWRRPPVPLRTQAAVSSATLGGSGAAWRSWGAPARRLRS